MKKYISSFLVVFLFLSGLSLLLYPLVANTWNNQRQKQLMMDYSGVVKDMEDENKIDYEAEWEKAYVYNEELLPSILPDSFAIAEASDDPTRAYLHTLDIAGTGIMGEVEIPKINVKLPIFHTTEPDVLLQAAGHLEGSSLPVGGENTHAVISAHRGLPSATLFTDLDKLEIGDHFLIHVLDGTLAYEVEAVNTVEPEDTILLSVQEGRDLVTLLTCTPYGVNTHRLLVTAKRVELEEEVTAVIKEEEKEAKKSLHTNYVLWVIIGLLATAIFILILMYTDNKYQASRKRRSYQKRKKAKLSKAYRKSLEESSNRSVDTKRNGTSGQMSVKQNESRKSARPDLSSHHNDSKDD
ncbi:MAG: class C sortase [Blautia sp.]|nr:class C sortase [Blautia sp.]